MTIKTIPLIGGKSSADLKLLCDLYRGSGCKVFFDPFAGSLRMSITILKEFSDSVVFAAESDKGLRCFYKLLLNSDRDYAREVYNDLKSELLDNKGYWSEIQALASGHHESDLKIGVARLIYQQNSVISTARHGSTGILNGKLADSKYNGLAARELTLPDYSDLCNRIYIQDDYANYTVYPHWIKIRDSFVNIDPPYFAPGKTKCYKDHDPSNCWLPMDAVRSYLQHKPKTVIAWNYYSDKLHLVYNNLAFSHGYKVILKEVSEIEKAKTIKSSTKSNSTHVLWKFDRL